MNTSLLQIYLNDHLALMTGELKVIERSRSSNAQSPLATFLERMRVEVDDQRAVTHQLLKLIDGKQNLLKEGMARLFEKVGRLKLNGSLVNYSRLSRLIELEGLSATTQTRLAFWESWGVLAGQDDRFTGFHFESLCEECRHQLVQLSQHRREAAGAAFLEN